MQGNKYVILVALAAAAAAPSGSRFEDWGPQSGIDFVLQNGATPEKRLIETMAGGLAVLDYDSDGKPDLYFVNGARQPQLEKVDSFYWNRLYRNLGGFHFEDVTERAGVQGVGYGIGAAAADYDNDGFPDLFVAGVNRNVLYRNKGDGSFEDVTDRAGLRHTGPQPWSVAAGWFDYDHDGRLDLFLVNYVRWDPAQEPFCGDAKKGYRTYCHPKFYQGLPNQLFRNHGDGTFRDVSAASGIAARVGKGMGVAFADYDQDGRLDVFVTNDTEPNFLFHNEGGGRFREVGMEAGVGLNDDGKALSSMGADFRDVDNDGRADLFFTALTYETFPLFRNLGKGLFADVTYPSRVGVATLPWSGWGAGIYDFNNDGWKDLFAAGGDVQDNAEVYSSRKSRQPNVILWNSGKGTFTGETVGTPALHRGAAFADLDGDGLVDVVVSRIQNRPVILRNRSREGHQWIGIRLIGKASNRDGLGARVRVVTDDGAQWNHGTTSVGYASSSDRTVHFGLGKQSRVRTLEVHWPSGRTQKLADLPVDRYLEVAEP
jgi:hypothetical protein